MPINCRFLLNKFPECFNLFVLFFLVSLCLIVAAQPCMKWIPIKKKSYKSSSYLVIMTDSFHWCLQKNQNNTDQRCSVFRETTKIIFLLAWKCEFSFLSTHNIGLFHRVWKRLQYKQKYLIVLKVCRNIYNMDMCRTHKMRMRGWERMLENESFL